MRRALVSLLLLAACRERPPTQYLVHLETNVGEIARYHVMVDGADMGDFARASSGATSFGIVAGGAYERGFRLAIGGIGSDGEPLGTVERDFVRFEPEAKIDVYLCFDRRCAERGCFGPAIDPAAISAETCAGVEPDAGIAVPEDPDLGVAAVDLGVAEDLGTAPADDAAFDAAANDPDAGALDPAPDAGDSGTSWTITFGGSADANDRVTHLAMADGGIVGVAEFTGDLQLGETSQEAMGSGQQGVVFGLTEDGRIPWGVQIESATRVAIGGMRVSSRGTVFVAGTFVEEVTSVFQNRVAMLGEELFIVAMNPLLQTGSLTAYSSMDDEQIRALAIDESNPLDVRLIIGGGFHGMFLELPGCRLVGFAQQWDAFIASISVDTMQCNWGTVIGSDGDDFVEAIAVSPSGEVYAAGEFTGFLRRTGREGEGPMTGHTNDDMFVEKFSRNGTPLAEAWLGSNGEDEAATVLQLVDRHLLVAGRFGSNLQLDGTNISVDRPYAVILDEALESPDVYSSRGLIHVHTAVMTSSASFAVAGDSNDPVTASDHSGATPDFVYSHANNTCGGQYIDDVLDVPIRGGRFDPRPSVFGGIGDDEPTAMLILPNGDHLVAGKFNCAGVFHGEAINAASNAFFDSFIHRFTPR